MQLTKQRSSLKWIALLSAPVVLIAGAFLIIGIVFFMMLAAATEEEPQVESTDYAGTNGMVYTISPVGEKEIPKQFIPIYKAAAEKYSIPWPLLAGEHKVETNFSSIKNMISPVGATGHLQFMPCTWVNLTV